MEYVRLYITMVVNCGSLERDWQNFEILLKNSYFEISVSLLYATPF